MLGDTPATTLDAIKEAVRSGARPDALGSAVAYAAFLRMAHFHLSNEFSDWDTVHNTLTAANALHQALKRAPSLELLRGVFDISMSIYLDRFLNMPAQRIPETNGNPIDGPAILDRLQERMDVRHQVEEVAELVSQHLTGGGEPEALLATLGQDMLREGFGVSFLSDRGRGLQAVRSAPWHRIGASCTDRDGKVLWQLMRPLRGR